MIHIKYAVECNYIINRKEVSLKNSLKIEYRERDRDKVYLQNVRDDTKKVSSEDKKWLFTRLKMKFNKVL